MNTTSLQHSRTKGSKNGIRLYQNKDGTWTELGKERRRIGRSGRSALGSLRQNMQDRRERKRKKEDEYNSIHNVIRSGNLSRVTKNRDRMTDQELREAINRIKLNTELSNLEHNRRVEQGQQFINRIGQIATAADKAYSIYNTYNKFQKALSEHTPEAKEKEANKKKIRNVIDSGDWSKIDKYKTKMTMEELDYMFKRQSMYKGIKEGLDNKDWRQWTNNNSGNKKNKNKQNGDND